jgi:hypothetical protein
LVQEQIVEWIHTMGLFKTAHLPHLDKTTKQLSLPVGQPSH